MALTLLGESQEEVLKGDNDQDAASKGGASSKGVEESKGDGPGPDVVAPTTT